jgi:type VI secretion system protein ImpA
LAALDVDKLLAAVSADSPAGQDLSYDGSYMALFNSAQGTPEQQVGETIVAAVDPNWRELRDGCVEILGKSKDLRVGVLAAVVALKVDGFPGLESGLALLRGMLDRYWDNLFPRLDPDDNNDPLERVNILAAMAAPPETFGDPLKLQKRVREAPLSASAQLGRFGLRDIQAATGEASTDSNSPRVEMSVIDGSFDDTSVETLKATADAIDRAIEHAKQIDAILDQKVGSAAPDLTGLHTCLKEVRTCLQRFLARRGLADAATDDGQSPNGAAAGGGGGSGASLSGDVRSTSDVLLAIDRICQYYERCEPSSPVPLLLKRARRLVSKSFLDIINDLSPDAISQIRVISGSEPEQG